MELSENGRVSSALTSAEHLNGEIYEQLNVDSRYIILRYFMTSASFHFHTDNTVLRSSMFVGTCVIFKQDMLSFPSQNCFRCLNFTLV